MAQNDPVKEAQGPNSTLRMPLWFLVVAVLLLSARVYIKQTQLRAPQGQGVAWLTPLEFKKQKESGTLGKPELVLYEFTADWCPPCKKRERTTFRNEAEIRKINSTFIPIRVDVTTQAKADEPETKRLTELYTVSRIPHCTITLKTGEFVVDDNYLYGETFEEFLDNSVTKANNVRAQLLCARGRNAEAMTFISPAVLKGEKEIYYYECTNYILCHHLLKVLNREAEIEPMMRKTYDVTIKERTARGTVRSTTFLWLDNLNSYLRGQKTADEAIAALGNGDGEGALYLAIGLKNWREGEIEKARKALNKAALLSAKSYNRDKLAEYILKEIDK